jgi:hypothetical protein
MSYSVSAAVEAFGCLSFARREDLQKSTHFVESLKIFPLASGGDFLHDNMEFHRSPCLRGSVDPVEL